MRYPDARVETFAPGQYRQLFECSGSGDSPDPGDCRVVPTLGARCSKTAGCPAVPDTEICASTLRNNVYRVRCNRIPSAIQLLIRVSGVRSGPPLPTHSPPGLRGKLLVRSRLPAA